ncbi:MAG: nicotianamine synthase family protein [Alphaproteobacteria bacterium]
MQALQATVAQVHRTLASQASLAPSAVVNAAFTQLVQVARTPARAPAVYTLFAELPHEQLASLHRYCSRGEYLLELDWARRILASATPKTVLRQFPYWQNYVKLTKLEVAAVRAILGHKPRHVGFAGSGPLPLTSIMLRKHYNIQVTNIDCDCVACADSRTLTARVLGQGIPTLHSNVAAMNNFNAFDVIWLAALVGQTIADKQAVMANLRQHMHQGQLLVVRSSKGLRQLLYPAVPATLFEGFALKREIHPRGEVVNSILIYEKL